MANAAVNLATERATVASDAGAVQPEDLVKAVAKAGYGLAPAPARGSRDRKTALEDDEHATHAAEALQKVWLVRILVAWPLSLAVLVFGMGFMHDPWARYASLVLTIPVQFWAGWPFLTAAATRARNLTSNMDTLIAMGTLAAFTFSTYQVLFAGHHSDHYFDTAALVIAFLLLGRWFEARAK